MKATTTLFCLLAFVLVVSACKKDDEITNSGNNNNEPETSITFIATEDDTLPLQGVLVGITPNEADRDNGIFLKSGDTGFNGRKTFDNLTNITYYWSATYSAQGGAVVRKGSVTLEIGDEVDRELNF